MNSFFNIGLDKLALAAAAGLCATLGMGLLKRKSVRDYYLNSDPVKKKSMDILHGYPHSYSIFGTPIKSDVVDTNHIFFDHKEDKATIPIRFKGGEKEVKYGMLYAYCSKILDKIDNAEIWRVDRLDVEVIESHKRWTFYVDPNNDVGTYNDTKPEDVQTIEQKS